MPRKNHRVEHVPLDLTPDVLPRQVSTGPRPGWAGGTQRAETDAQRSERQRLARMRVGIDWTVCLVPGCGRSVAIFGKPDRRYDERDSEASLPMCHPHLVVAWRQIQKSAGNPTVVAAIQDADAEQRRKDDEREAHNLAQDQGGTGVIYFIRHNGLVKAGWTSNFFNRLKSYGPGAEVLCHYPGTRADETALHRQLRPALAKGREWYHDGDLVALFVKHAVERHGRPSITSVYWTEPKPDMVAQRRRR